MLSSHDATSDRPAPSPCPPASTNTTRPANNPLVLIRPEHTMERVFNCKTFARQPLSMTNPVSMLRHQSWDDSLHSSSAPFSKSTKGDPCRLSDTDLTTVLTESMGKVDGPGKSRLRQADETASMERHEVCREGRLQSRQAIERSTDFARELPQSILATHRTYSDAANHRGEGNMVSSVVHVQYTIQIPGDNGRVWTTLHVNAPTGLTAKLPTNQLQTVVGHLTEFAWFECEDHSLQSDSRTLLRTLAKLVSSLLPRLTKCRIRRYIAVLSHIDRHVVLRSGKQAQVLGMSRNKVLVKSAGHMRWVEGSDIVRAMRCHPKAAKRDEGKSSCTVIRLPGLPHIHTNGTVDDPVQGELVTILTGRALTRAAQSKSNAAVSELSAGGSESPSESVAAWRTHDAYQAAPRDGKYRCPWEDCTKKPMDFKSQYHKHIDHHLKPFRCNQKTCLGTRFSNNDCLRRHVRQQHATAAHFCPVLGCKRGTRGFTREYNLRDHVKRIHKSMGTGLSEK